RIVGGVPAEETDRAAVAADQSEQHPHRRRLPGAVRTEEAVDVTPLDRQIHMIDGGQVAVAFDEATHFGRWLLTHRDPSLVGPNIVTDNGRDSSAARHRGQPESADSG